MKRVSCGPVAELAPGGSDVRPSIQRIRRGHRPLMLGLLVEAARADDRRDFDRHFDRCFERVYAIAFHVTRSHARSQVLTARILCEAVKDAM